MKNIDKLLEVMTALRHPETGCPWDVEQSFETIAPYTIEEAYEVADAIAEGDMEGLKGELGDLLLNVVFHAEMAREQGFFDFNDVAGAISDKMQRRHPHVFGSPEERAAGPVEGSWEAIKAEERGNSGAPGDTSALADITRSLPALKRAQKLGSRASAVGFDWPDLAGVREKITEELDEVSEAVGSRDAEHIREEVGDLLFSVVNLARHLDVDAEDALAAANRKFEQRFRTMETLIADDGEDVKAMDIDALEKAWRRAKNA